MTRGSAADRGTGSRPGRLGTFGRADRIARSSRHGPTWFPSSSASTVSPGHCSMTARGRWRVTAGRARPTGTLPARRNTRRTRPGPTARWPTCSTGSSVRELERLMRELGNARSAADVRRALRRYDPRLLTMSRVGAKTTTYQTSPSRWLWPESRRATRSCAASRMSARGWCAYSASSPCMS